MGRDGSRAEVVEKFSAYRLTKTRGAFPNENSLLKLLYMGIQNASKKWTMPLQNWNLTLSQLSIYFEGRLDDVLDIWTNGNTPEK